MDQTLQLLTIVVVVIGTFFSVVGILGYLRFPDAYTRLHATGKVGVFGVVLLLVAAAFWTPLGWAKALLLIILLMMAGPVSAHAIASAAYRVGIPMAEGSRDDLAPLVEHPQTVSPLKQEP
ncbi:MAG: monovalent cation/H(+) antiporter subunit G [Chloroflexota bacterium]|nr:monovalent cation/H(+) antiporter subunit G [Chloroflexota bacterium]